MSHSGPDHEPRKVLVAGASGAIGRHLVPMLVSVGHSVTGTTRSEGKVPTLRRLGASPLVVDVYDIERLRAGVDRVRPDVIVNQLTDLAAGVGPENLRATTRLRTEGARNLVDAARRAGVHRMVAQSVAWLYGPGPGDRVEADPLLDPRQHPDDLVLPGVIALERTMLGAPDVDAIILRYGFLYGPLTGVDGPIARPSVEVRAAARAAQLAVSRGRPGIYNVVDDGGAVSNARAFHELGWRPDEP